MTTVRKTTEIRWYLSRFRRALFTVVRSVRSESDPDFWANLENHDRGWDARTRKIASLIPNGAHVLEFGAGRRQLEQWLSDGCTYTPSDIVDRGPGTLSIDLNQRPLPVLADSYDIAVFGGVLEYVHDVEAVLTWLAKSNIPTIIATYETVSHSSFMQRMRRAGSGWVNTYTAAELRASLAKAGYPIVTNDSWDWGGGSGLVLIAEELAGATAP